MTNTAIHNNPISIVDNQGLQTKQASGSPNNMDPTSNVGVDIGGGPENPTADPDFARAESDSEVPLEVRCLWAGLDLDFQAPIGIKTRATHATVEVTS